MSFSYVFLTDLHDVLIAIVRIVKMIVVLTKFLIIELYK
jgi:hypothetical protein